MSEKKQSSQTELSIYKELQNLKEIKNQKLCQQNQIHSQKDFENNWSIKPILQNNTRYQSDKKLPSLSLNSQTWTLYDQISLIESHKRNGNKWTIIAQGFQNRSQAFIKNRFYSLIRKSVRKLNRRIKQEFKNKQKKLQLNVIFKLANLVEGKLTKASSQVVEYYKNLMYSLIDFSIDDQNRLQKYSAKQIQNFALSLKGLENLSKIIRANRKPKRGRKSRAQSKYFISNDGLCLLVVQDTVVFMNQVQAQKYYHIKNTETDRSSGQLFQNQQFSMNSLKGEIQFSENPDNNSEFQGDHLSNMIQISNQNQQNTPNEIQIVQFNNLNSKDKQIKQHQNQQQRFNPFDYIMQDSYNKDHSQLPLGVQEFYETDFFL